MVRKDAAIQSSERRSRGNKRRERPRRGPVDFAAIAHFYSLRSFSIRPWRPVESVAYMLFNTIWFDESVHCNVEIDGLIYDNSLDHGVRVLEQYPARPSQSVRVPCKLKPMKLATFHSLAKKRHPTWPAILDALGIWPKGLKVPYTCVTLSCIMLGLPILESRRPAHLLRRLIDGNLRLTRPTTATTVATTGHVGAGRDTGAQETRES